MNTPKQGFFNSKPFKLMLIVLYIYSIATFDPSGGVSISQVQDTEQSQSNSVQVQLAHIGIDIIQNLITRAKLFLG